MKHRTKLRWKTPSIYIYGQTVTIVGSAINQRTLRFLLNIMDSDAFYTSERGKYLINCRIKLTGYL